jgi:hypothetical protein
MHFMSSFTTLVTSCCVKYSISGVCGRVVLTVFQTPYFFVSDFSVAPLVLILHSIFSKGKKVGNDYVEPIQCCRNWF